MLGLGVALVALAKVVLGSLFDLPLRGVQFGAGDPHGQHHLFFGALAFFLRGDLGQLALVLAVANGAEGRGDKHRRHGGRHRPP